MAIFHRYAALLLFLVVPMAIQAQLTIRFELQQLPAGHEADSIYLTGSFNGWNPAMPLFRFQKAADGTRFLVVKQAPKGILEYKLTRGSWASAECMANGKPLLNRMMRLTRDTTLQLSVAGWTDDFPSRPPVSSRSKHVFILDTAFQIPQLNRTRRIWVYLPADYATTRKRYPVMYMQDGQNLFDVITSGYGEWGLDEMMDSVQPARQCIIVGVDHGNSTRLTEYNPFSSRFGKGEGDAYLDFLATRLKPFIDSAYRTRSGAASTMLGGSSMGGLIAAYGVIKYPQVFGRAAVLSPSFWIAPQLADVVSTASNLNQTAFYFVCGGMESDQMETDMQKMADQIRQKGAKVAVKLVPDGRHHESFWQQEMPACYRWLRSTIR